MNTAVEQELQHNMDCSCNLFFQLIFKEEFFLQNKLYHSLKLLQPCCTKAQQQRQTVQPCRLPDVSLKFLKDIMIPYETSLGGEKAEPSTPFLVFF